ncbi:MAG: toll/interleukin-1 receptor domain-containing protein [Oscillospiraceae bacterium]|nr:toll/interleukin-1 receptor domain-containing protein [Oscillospiraceae bacterium]
MERRDIFISYTKKDTEQAVWIAKVLESRRYTVCMQQSDINPGQSFLGKMNDFLKNSDYFIAVWSEAYSQSPYCITEMEAAFHEFLKKRIKGFLPIRIENYQLEPLYSAIVHIDLFGMSKTEAKRALIKGVYSMAPPNPSPSAQPTPPPSNPTTPPPPDPPAPPPPKPHPIWKFLAQFVRILTIMLFCVDAVIWHMLILRPPPQNDTETVTIAVPEEHSTETRELSDTELWRMGLRYSEAENYTKAREYYEQAARKGNTMALYLLGQLYYEGAGVDVDYTKAREYYEPAAEQGNKYALYRLAMLYEYGQGVPMNYPKAIEYYQQAADQGYADAAARAKALRAKLNE